VRAVASRARDAVPPPPRTVPRASLGAGDGPKILLAGWRLSGRGDADAAAALVLSRLLFGAGGRVERRVPAAEGPVVQAQGDLDVRRDASLLHTVAVVSESADTSMAESLLLDVIESAATEPPAPGELERARRQAEAALLFPAQGAQGRGQALALAQMVGGRWAAWQAEVEAVRRVTAEDVTRVAGAHLVPAARSIVWVRTPARGESP
jgi:zinc protease